MSVYFKRSVFRSNRFERDLLRLVLWFFLCFTRSSSADVNFHHHTIAHFASVSEGSQILTNKDDFIQRLSAFDRSARMKTDKPISEKEFLEFIKNNIVAWTDTEKRTIENALDHLRPGLEALPLSLPKMIYLVKTTGAEEGKAFYTRGNAVVFPQDQLSAGRALLEKTICHELFHILSRENPKLREELYKMIGFEKCAEVHLPTQLQERKMTNPDAPKNDHYIRVRVAGRETSAVPILFSSVEKYDVARRGEFFNYLQFRFLLLEGTITSSPKPAADGSPGKLVAAQEVSGFVEQVGQNTDYVIHPEEILADNFALLVIGQQNVPSPEILHKMKAILTRK